MTSYGQFCPIAKAMEVLDERWTLLVVRELLLGTTRWADLRKGVPRMSPALLSKRLRTLERAGVVQRHSGGGHATYALTPAGQELYAVVQALGMWGLRWIGELGEQDYDPHLLLWDLRRTIPTAAWPAGRTVLAFAFDDVPVRQSCWWLVVSEGEVDVCDADPGYPVAATVRTGLRTLTRIWRGELGWRQALRSGSVVVDGPVAVQRALPRWIGESTLTRAAAAPPAARVPARDVVNSRR